MVAIKLIITLALVTVLAPTCTYSAAITDEPETTVNDMTDDTPDDDGFVPFWNLVNWIRDFIFKKQQQIVDEIGNKETEFTTEFCNSADNSGVCSFQSYDDINGNCTIYTIGSCANFINLFAEQNCVHKCKLPTGELSTTVLPTEATTSEA